MLKVYVLGWEENKADRAKKASSFCMLYLSGPVACSLWSSLCLSMSGFVSCYYLFFLFFFLFFFLIINIKVNCYYLGSDMLIGVIIIQEPFFLLLLRNNLTANHTHTLNYTLSPSSNTLLNNDRSAIVSILTVFISGHSLMLILLYSKNFPLTWLLFKEKWNKIFQNICWVWYM